RCALCTKFRVAGTTLLPPCIAVYTVGEMNSEEATSSSAADDNREGEFVVQDDWFECGGSRCSVRVYRPAADGLVRPTIVMAHGFGAVRALRLYAYAERFAAAGYVVLVFDYRGFGESEGEPRQVLSVRKQH